jgi:hypothetical protein
MAQAIGQNNISITKRILSRKSDRYAARSPEAGVQRGVRWRRHILDGTTQDRGSGACLPGPWKGAGGTAVVPM